MTGGGGGATAPPPPLVSGTADTLVPIFDDRLQGYYWSYDDSGLKLLQLRFYECATVVDLDGSWTDSCGRTGH